MVSNKFSHAIHNLQLELKTGKNRSVNPRALTSDEIAQKQDRLQDLKNQQRAQKALKDVKQAVDDGVEKVVKKTEANKTEIMGQGSLILEKLDKLQMVQQAPASSSAEAPPITAAAPDIDSEKEEPEGSESELDLEALSEKQQAELSDEEARAEEEVDADLNREMKEPLNECNRKVQEAVNERKRKIQEVDDEHKRKLLEAYGEYNKLKEERVDEEFGAKYAKASLVCRQKFKKRLVELSEPARG